MFLFYFYKDSVQAVLIVIIHRKLKLINTNKKIPSTYHHPVHMQPKTPDLMQVVDFTALMQDANKLYQAC